MTWLDEAAQVTRQDRQKQYGAPLINFLRIALLWSTYLGRVMTPLDVVWMMLLVKVGREMNTHKDDNGVDGIGYIACWQQMDEEMKGRGYPDGALALQKMTLDDMHALAALLTEEAKFRERNQVPE